MAEHCLYDLYLHGAAVILTLESVFGTSISVILGEEVLTFNIALGFCLIFIAIITSETKLKFLQKPHS